MGHKFKLGCFPTPLQELSRLSKKFPGYNLFIKRDDQTGLATGGNKTRKLEYLIQQAMDDACDTVITAGAQQSNHCRQTAAACAMAGLECHFLLGGDEPSTADGNLLLSSLMGASIHFTGKNRKGEDIPNIRAELEAKGKKCAVMLGISSPFLFFPVK
jgi:D-cysteine desulfhydrase